MDELREPGYLLWSNTTDIVILNIIGVVICLYSLYIEVNKERNPNYRALCDFNEHMSCSKVLTSEYSIGFGFMHLLLGKNHALNARNCNIGLVVYVTNLLMSLVLPISLATTVMFYCSIVSVLGCVYLAFILFLILKDICVVCISMYVVNGYLLYLTYQAHKFYH
ncbi:vitamin K epoxide reductase complex subunit 1-like protein 1 [Biomphalaria pfeifferi]|uniref:vitamin-K-epoxide reductase (warfarin-sensitive) n=1 Tax=Biomphalaria pfeifferi TaxID=112525 RepID=A0AAD8BMB4_BIOPF|nr:vitamin K epoxide reductase complex subunit 1-like protein 1 [Biomphalaria pfeifferi]